MVSNPVDKRTFEEAVERAVSCLYKWSRLTNKEELTLEILKEIYPKLRGRDVLKEAETKYYAERYL